MAGVLPRRLSKRGYDKGSLVVKAIRAVMERSQSPLVSIIVLGYNGLRFLEAGLASILTQDLAEQYEVIYVDNASSDGSVAYVRKNFERVKILALERNLGFAEGNNEAIRHAAGRYLLFLNQDIILHRRCLREMVQTLRANRRLGACHANMLMPWHEEFAAQERVEYPRYVYYTDLNPRYGFAEYLKRPMQAVPIPTSFLSGGCFLIDRAVLQQLPYLFDARFFMYAEDVDLALRIKALGYQLALAPRAVVYHWHDAPGMRGLRELRNAYLATRNRFLAYYKTANGTEFLDQLPWLLIGSPLKVLQVGDKRLVNWLTFVVMLPITLISLIAALKMMPGYAEEKRFWSRQRITPVKQPTLDA